MEPRGRALVAAAALALASGCGSGDARRPATPSVERAPATLRLRVTPAFAPGGRLPRAMTCDGAGAEPRVEVGGVPARAAETVLTVEDPDAPGGTFVHWVRVSRGPRVVAEGRNSAGGTGWTPPCPPPGARPHRYVFRAYALAQPSGLRPGAEPDDVRAALSRGVLARGSVTGTYAR